MRARAVDAGSEEAHINLAQLLVRGTDGYILASLHVGAIELCFASPSLRSIHFAHRTPAMEARRDFADDAIPKRKTGTKFQIHRAPVATDEHPLFHAENCAVRSLLVGCSQHSCIF